MSFLDLSLIYIKFWENSVLWNKSARLIKIELLKKYYNTDAFIVCVGAVWAPTWITWINIMMPCDFISDRNVPTKSYSYFSIND